MYSLGNILHKSSKQLGKICLGLGVASIVQGSYFITRYRLNHGDAPHPISPSSGLVLLNKDHRNTCRHHANKDDDEDERDDDELPLKIFVVGDSLAAGCGICRSSTPVLPESIAKHLARELGRPVQWSCVGSPGASTKGITKILHKWFANGYDSSIIQKESNNDYDVVVVLAGMNDMKDTLLPFLAYERTESSFGDGLKNIFGVVKERLRLQKNKAANYLEQQPQSQRRSLVVLPALPTNAIPLFSYPPIGLIANSIISYMDSAKQKLSLEFPNKILFVEAPSGSLIQNIENGTSNLCNNLNSERAVLALNYIKEDVRRKVERLMQEHTMAFEQDDDDSNAEVEFEQALQSTLQPPEIFELGSSLVSYDSIHPNEKGYEYWGRHIAAAIIEEWKRQSH
ncbi:hypothetical protein ACHAWC_010080 [Mediolabrus comicus]